MACRGRKSWSTVTTPIHCHANVAILWAAYKFKTMSGRSLFAEDAARSPLPLCGTHCVHSAQVVSFSLYNFSLLTHFSPSFWLLISQCRLPKQAKACQALGGGLPAWYAQREETRTKLVRLPFARNSPAVLTSSVQCTVVTSSTTFSSSAFKSIHNHYINEVLTRHRNSLHYGTLVQSSAKQICTQNGSPSVPTQRLVSS